MKKDLICSIAALLLLSLTLPAINAQEEREGMRVALFNIRELSTEKLLEVDDSGVGTNDQLVAAAKIIQHIAPEVLVLNEIDHDYTSPDLPLETNGKRFVENYLRHGEDPIDYKYIYAAPCNTGILTGIDFNGDGVTSTEDEENSRPHGDDSFGYGSYPGQYSMMLLSQHPILADDARTFQKFLWKDMPGNLIPADFYSEEAVDIFRLSSKSHWDVPIKIGDKVVHFLMSHPTPQSFDGEEDRNGRRNFDEVRFWAEYINGADWIYDDEGKKGGIAEDAAFMIAGDQNTGTGFDGQSVYGGKEAYQLITEHALVTDTTPMITSRGAQERFGFSPEGKAAQYTFQWYGGSRLDYLLPSKGIEVHGGEALANTEWAVVTPAGEPVIESVGAFPSVVLAAGEYTAIAKHDERIFERTFTVEPGLNRDVEVLLAVEEDADSSG